MINKNNKLVGQGLYSILTGTGMCWYSMGVMPNSIARKGSHRATPLHDPLWLKSYSNYSDNPTSCAGRRAQEEA